MKFAALRRFRFRLRTLIRRDTLIAELDEEMQFHRDQIAADLERRGTSPSEAALAAKRQFGNPLAMRERSTSNWGAPLIEHTWQDVRFGLRLLARSPLFAIVATTAIAISIGINAAAFTFIDVLMLRPLPVANPANLVKLLTVNGRHMTSLGFSYRDVRLLSAEARSIRDVIAYAPQPVALRTAPTSVAMQGSVGGVSSNYFAALGGEATIGRLIDSDDAVDGSPAVATISDALWERAYQRRSDIVGRSITVNEHAVVIVGVARPDFIGINPLVPDMWMPLRTASRLGVVPGDLDDASNRFIVVHARLREGFTLSQAADEVSRLVADPPAIAGSAAEFTRVAGVSLMPSESAVPHDAETMLMIVPALCVVALVLLIASANLGNVMIARMLARQREIAVRLAVGASEGRILRQFLAESAVIALLGTLLGLALGEVVVTLITRIGLADVPATYGRITMGVHLSWRVVCYSAVLSGLSVATFGIAPALQASRRDPLAGLKGEDSALGFRIRRSRFRNALVAIQVGACVFVLVAVGVLVHNLRLMAGAPSGLDQQHLVVAQMGLTTAGHVRSDVARDREQFAQRALRISGVSMIARTSSAPYSAWPLLHVAAAATSQQLNAMPMAAVTPTYFETTGQRVVDGVPFSSRDSATNIEVAIVSQTAARELWPSANAVGQQMRIAGEGSATDRVVRVIGVVSDARNQSVRESEHSGYIYLPARASEFATQNMPFVIRTSTRPELAIHELRRLAAEIDPAEPLVATPASALVDRQLLPFRYVAASAAGVGLFAALLATVGLYGVVAFIVAQRRRDIAVHVALGAANSNVIMLVFRELKPVALGLSAGVVAALALVPILGSMTFELSALPAVQFVAIVAALACLAIIAAAVPARRALQIGPMEVLRQD